MTPEQIEAFNRKNRMRKLEWKDINGKTVVIENEWKRGLFSGIFYHLEDPLTITMFPGNRIREDFRTLRNYIDNTALWDRRQIPFPAERKQELLDSIEMDSVSETIQPKHGLIIRHTLQRMAPVNSKVYNQQYGWLDMFQKAVLETGMPVAILHATKDRDWYYVRSEYSVGWVPASNVAVGPERDIRRLAEPDNFIVAITHKVPVFADQSFSMHLTDIYMGAQLPLVNRTAAGYRVSVPYRLPDGSLETASGWVRPDAQVSVGYQPYTRRAVIETIFRLLNRPYGWGGTDHERDCVGTIRAVYKTFGIFMPRWTVFELYSTDHVFIFPKDTPKEVKYRYLDKCEPGITVCGFNWHVVLYLGKVGDIHYTIHENGFSYHDDDGTEVRVGRISVNSTEIEGGGNIELWTELSGFKP